MELVVYDGVTDARKLNERGGFALDGDRMKKRLT
jgi:hypothetical protein